MKEGRKEGRNPDCLLALLSVSSSWRVIQQKKDACQCVPDKIWECGTSREKARLIIVKMRGRWRR
jgi:hypothetical protein